MEICTVNGERVKYRNNVDYCVSCFTFFFCCVETLHIIVECESLKILKGTIKQKGSHVGSIAEYGCDEGFLIIGRIHRECLLTGAWSGTNPVCISNDNQKNGMF